MKIAKALYPGLGAIKGAELLHGVHLVDRIGHFGSASMDTLQVFLTVVIRWAMVSQARL